MQRRAIRGAQIPGRKGGGENEEHWLDNLELGREEGGEEADDLLDLDDEELTEEEEGLEEEEEDY